MRLYIYELVRLWKTPGILFALAVACVSTVGVLSMKSKEMLTYVQPAEYKEAFAKLDGMNAADAYAIYKDEEYDVMDFSQEALLTKTVKDEVLEQATYEEYLSGITESACRLTSVSIFADKDSFSYKNALCISEVYDQLRGKIVIKSGPSKGVELWSENGVTGLIVLLVLCTMINEIILKDRETGQLNLLFTMDKGRTKHGFVKIGVIGISAFCVTFIILLTAFISSASIFGIGDIMRPVQSVVGLKGCTIETSVLGYMAVYFLKKSNLSLRLGVCA